MTFLFWRPSVTPLRGVTRWFRLHPRNPLTTPLHNSNHGDLPSPSFYHSINLHIFHINKNYFNNSGCHPLWGCHPVRSAPPAPPSALKSKSKSRLPKVVLTYKKLIICRSSSKIHRIHPKLTHTCRPTCKTPMLISTPLTLNFRQGCTLPPDALVGGVFTPRFSGLRDKVMLLPGNLMFFTPRGSGLGDKVTKVHFYQTCCNSKLTFTHFKQNKLLLGVLKYVPANW